MAVSNVELRVDARNAVDQLRKTNTEAKKLEQTVNKTNGKLSDASGRFASTGKAAGTATGNIQRLGIAFRTTLGPVVALYGAVTFFNRSLQVASQRQVDVAKLTNGLRNLGATASDLERLQVAADKFGNTTLFDQEDATQAFALLTSFQRIGVESYERVTKAASDLATITGQDLKSAQIQLAKALEDPTKRVTDLARSGTVFTDQQKEQIKVLQESGQLLEAQNLILNEIEKQYGGAAVAAGSAGLAGALDSLSEATRDFQEALGGTQSLIDGVTYVVNLLTEGVKGLEKGLKDADTIIKAVGILAEQAGLGAIEFGKGIEFLKETILNALPQLRLYLFALEQINKLAGKVVDSQAGQRNFGANYASQERALFEAAGGFNPYKSNNQQQQQQQQQQQPKAQNIISPTGNNLQKAMQDRISNAQKYLQEEAKAKAEIEKQGELLADALKSSQRAVELAEARLSGNEDEVRLQHEIADIQEKFKDNGADILIQDLKRVKALEDQKDAADALAKAEEERRKNDPGVQMQQELDKLLDKQNQAAAAATAFGNAFSTAITSVINGTKSADQAIADMLSSVAEHFMDMAAQIIAKQLAIIAYGLIAKALGVPGLGGAGGGLEAAPLGAGFSTGATPSSFDAVGAGLFAKGGYVSGPTRALVGEGGEPEYIIPESKMRESMSRYSRGARGGSVIPEAGGSGTSGEDGGIAVAAPIDVRYTVERINSVDYVTADQFQQGMQQAANQGARQGEQQTLKRLQMSSGTRRRLGM